MKFLTKVYIFLAVFLITLIGVELTAQSITFPPAIGGLTVQYFGRSGGATDRYYWVQPIYPFGRGALSNSVLTTTVDPLTQTDVALVTWNPSPGATGYDVLRTATSTAPTGACNCAVSVNQFANTVNDRGAALGTYTVATLSTLPTGGQIVTESNVVTAQVATDTATITAAQMLNGLLTGTPTGAANYTTQTATQLTAAMTSCIVGRSYDLAVKNTAGGAFTITFLAGTSVTLSGTMTVTQNNIRHFKIVATNCTTPAVTMYSMGGAAF